MQDCLILVTNCFSTQTSYENQTKKAITNKFVQEAMTEFFRSRLHVYFIENKAEADKIADQVLINKRSRETAEKARLNIKKKLTGIRRYCQPRPEICRLPDARTSRAAKFTSSRATRALGSCQALARRGISGHHARARQDLELPQGGL